METCVQFSHNFMNAPPDNFPDIVLFIFIMTTMQQDCSVGLANYILTLYAVPTQLIQ